MQADDIPPDQPLPSAHAAAAAAAAAAFAKEAEAKVEAKWSGKVAARPATPSSTKANAAPSTGAPPKPQRAYVAQSVAEKKWPTLSPRSAVAKEEELTRLSVLPAGMMFAPEISEQEALLGLRGGDLRGFY